MCLEHLARAVSAARCDRATKPKKASDGVDPSVYLAALQATEV